MRVHHKQPALVSMWMLDVFCCALGCVTLLWLLNTKHAAEQTVAARTALHDLLATRTDLDSTRSERDSTKHELATTLTEFDTTKQKLDLEVERLTLRLGEVASARLKLDAEAKALMAQRDAANKDKDETASQLAAAQQSITKLEQDKTKSASLLKQASDSMASSAKDLTALQTQAANAQEMLRKKQSEADALAAKLAAAGTTADSLTKKLTESAVSAEELAKLARKKDQERAAAIKLAVELQAKIDLLDSQLKIARRETADTKSATTKSAEELATTAGQVKDLEKKLADARVMIIDLQGEKGKLADRFDKIQKDTDSKFAGIALTGKRVVFLVDRSGSMDRTTELVLAPNKWAAVAETVAKVMRSLPDLEQFQVVVFSKQPQWLFGTGEWQRFEGEKSAEAVRNALLKTKVEGDTNLYAAFDLAFQQRDRGMDTIYLFSDGLPTSGPGLTDEQLRQNPPLRVTEQAEILARHVRGKLTSSWNRAYTNQPKVRINAVGFFYESPDVGAFLWALARENDGSFVGMSRP